VVVSRFTRVTETDLVIGDAVAANSVRTVWLSPLKALTEPATAGSRRGATGRDIMRFYASLMGDVPYTSATVALLESDLPGGHSPGYFAVIKTPLALSPATWRGDPAAFENFPEFFLAHELAHQWWGQAVGWKNYHEQWISEGFAQYFAALYAPKARGERLFTDMVRHRRWAISDSDQGPVHLGYRLGLVKGMCACSARSSIARRRCSTCCDGLATRSFCGVADFADRRRGWHQDLGALEAGPAGCSILLRALDLRHGHPQSDALIGAATWS
jgi:hypothetical protein